MLGTSDPAFRTLPLRRMLHAETQTLALQTHSNIFQNRHTLPQVDDGRLSSTVNQRYSSNLEWNTHCPRFLRLGGDDTAMPYARVPHS
jgi:hypothetical protein